MPSFAHKKLIERIARVDEVPDDAAAYGAWIAADQHLNLLRHNAEEDELIVYGSGNYTFIHSVVVPNDRLVPIDQDNLLRWSCNPFDSIASYVYGGGRDDVWIERGTGHGDSEILGAAKQLVFGRTFEGFTGEGRTYFELLQEYTHIAQIHWRPEQRAYCQFDRHGDIDHIVSITLKEKQGGISLVSFKREPLEHYLAASNCTLVRLFDFTLLRYHGFSGWPEGAENVVKSSEDLFYRQKIISGHAAYTRGVQIIHSSRPQRAIFAEIKGQSSGRRDKRYVEFLVHDWRNERVARISTDPVATTNYFEAAGNSLPFEVSPAFFRSEVLLKYKGDRDKYTIGPRDISCRGAWSLRAYDVNEAGQVHAYICYLRDLPYEEQLHWASFNEPPKAPISKRAFINDIKGEFSTHIDPLQRVVSIARNWDEKNLSWWKLRDAAQLKRVSTPRTTSRDEWAEAFMDLSKLINEGFEVKALRAKLAAAQIAFDERDQSVALVEKLLPRDSISPDEHRLEGLRTVQLIRSKVKGHSAGSQAIQLANQALKRHETFAAHFEHVCELVADEVERIEPMLS